MTEVGSFYGRRGQAQASEILCQTRELFAGGSLSEEDQKAFAIEMQRILWIPRRWHVKSSRRRNTGRMPKMTAPDLLPESW